ncbi:MAG: hypothetical protein HC799_01270 [Limnothrix sp. RL_2_0]|nr:hypothetical protein [Limnothrix sp. RL_2_0]
MIAVTFSHGAAIASSANNFQRVKSSVEIRKGQSFSPSEKYCGQLSIKTQIMITKDCQ